MKHIHYLIMLLACMLGGHVSAADRQLVHNTIRELRTETHMRTVMNLISTLQQQAHLGSRSAIRYLRKTHRMPGAWSVLYDHIARAYNTHYPDCEIRQKYITTRLKELGYDDRHVMRMNQKFAHINSKKASQANSSSSSSEQQPTVHYDEMEQRARHDASSCVAPSKAKVSLHNKNKKRKRGNATKKNPPQKKRPQRTSGYALSSVR